MEGSANLSRRKRQIMDILYTNREAAVLEIQAGLPEAPVPMAARQVFANPWIEMSYKRRTK